VEQVGSTLVTLDNTTEHDPELVLLSHLHNIPLSDPFLSLLGPHNSLSPKLFHKKIIFAFHVSLHANLVSSPQWHLNFSLIIILDDIYRSWSSSYYILSGSFPSFSNPSVIQPVASRYVHCATTALPYAEEQL
jgi:hypothetical protein